MDITQQWMDQRESVEITGGTVVLRPYDITMILDEGGHILNPLIAKAKDLIEDRKKEVKKAVEFTDLIEQLQHLPELRKLLNGLLEKVILEPDLNQFELDRFTIQQKGEIFTYMLGGKTALAQVNKFFREQVAGMATVQPSSEIQHSPIIAAGDPTPHP